MGVDSDCFASNKLLSCTHGMCTLAGPLGSGPMSQQITGVSTLWGGIAIRVGWNYSGQNIFQIWNLSSVDFYNTRAANKWTTFYY